MVTWSASLQPLLSVAIIVKLNVPATLGVPANTPVVAFSVNPVGNVPLALQLGVPAPPVWVKVWLYGTPAMPDGRLAGVTVMLGQTIVSE